MDVPIYRPVRTAPSRKGPRVSTGRNQAFDIIQHRAQQRLGEIDTAKAIDAFNSFRDEGRDELSNQLSKQGEDAIGVAESHKSWIDKRIKVYENESLAGFNQKAQFKRMALQYRAGNLNQAARHEAVQHQAWMNQTANNFLAGQMDDAAKAYNDPAIVEQIIGAYEYKLDGLFPGINKDAEKMVAAASIRTAAIEAAIRNDPAYALELIDKWQNVEGMNAEDLTVLRNRVETIIDENMVEAAYVEIKTIYNDDLDGAIEFLRSEDHDLNPEIANKVLSKIKTLRTERRLIKLQRETQIKDDVFNDANGLLRKGEMQAARAVIDGNPDISETDKRQWENGLTSVQPISDPDLYNNLTIKALSGELNPNDVIPHIGKGLTPNDAEHVRSKAIETRKGTYGTNPYKTATEFAESQIFGGSGLMQIKTPKDHVRYKNWIDDFDDALREGEQDNKKLSDMLDPDSKDYVVEKTLRPYLLTDMQKLSEQVEEFRKGLPVDKDKTDTIPKRKPNETIPEYLKRTGQ